MCLAENLPLKAIDPYGLGFTLAPIKARHMNDTFREEALGYKVLD